MKGLKPMTVPDDSSDATWNQLGRTCSAAGLLSAGKNGDGDSLIELYI